MKMILFPFEAGRGQSPETDAKFQADIALRIAMINKLKGGPGQINRALVEAYLQFKRWGNTPEQWSLYALPRDDEAFAGLLNDIMDFERAMMDGERVKN